MQNPGGMARLAALMVVMSMVAGGVLAAAGPVGAQGAPAPAAAAPTEGETLLGTDQMIVTPAAGQPLSTDELAADAGTPVEVVRPRDGGSYVVKLPDAAA